jgi:hypothetical protein
MVLLSRIGLSIPGVSHATCHNIHQHPPRCPSNQTHPSTIAATLTTTELNTTYHKHHNQNTKEQRAKSKRAKEQKSKRAKEQKQKK